MPSIESHAGGTSVAIDVDDTGGEGRTVVLIHGWPLDKHSWAPVVPALVDAGYRVVSYDRRGFGASDKPEDGYDYDTMAGDLDAVLTALDLQDVTLVGFSMGGGEVARYVGKHGSARVRAGVFASAIPPYLLKTDDNPDGGLGDEDVKGMKQGLSDDREGFFGEFAKNFYTAGEDLKVDQDVIDTWLRLAAPASTTAALGCIDAFGRTDLRADLAAFDVPVLVIHGDSDAIVPFEVSGKRTAEAVEDSTLVVVEKGPHGITDSHTGEFTAALLEFLAAH